MIKEEEIQRLVEKIAKKYKPEKIILFGSFAWGKAGVDSDVDLLIIKKTDKKRIERNLEVKKIINGSLPVDILVYTPKEIEKSIDEDKNLFIEDILRNGKMIYDNSKINFNKILPKRKLNVLNYL